MHFPVATAISLMFYRGGVWNTNTRETQGEALAADVGAEAQGIARPSSKKRMLSITK